MKEKQEKRMKLYSNKLKRLKNIKNKLKNLRIRKKDYNIKLMNLLKVDGLDHNIK